MPVTEKKPNKINDKPQSKSVYGTETILVVEDEALLLSTIKDVLETNGYSIYTAADGVEAIRRFEAEKNNIQLVFSDSGLPKLGGWEAFCRMREINPEIRAVFASGYFEPELKDQMVANGVADFINKPYDLQDLVLRLRRVLDNYSPN